MFKILNFNCSVFSWSNPCSFKIVSNAELFKSVCFDGRSQSQLFSHPFIYDSNCFDTLWRSQWFLIIHADTPILYLPEIKDSVWHSDLMNIVVWLLEVDSIVSVEIWGKHGVKCLVLANLQYGLNFSLNSKTIGEAGGETI